MKIKNDLTTTLTMQLAFKFSQICVNLNAMQLLLQLFLGHSLSQKHAEY